MPLVARLALGILLGLSTYPLYAHGMIMGEFPARISCGIATLGCVFAFTVPLPGFPRRMRHPAKR